MIKLETLLTLDDSAMLSPNLCDRFSERDLGALGRLVVDGYKRDLQSRAKWEKRMQSAMNLALQVQQDKSFPWPNCSNIAFPLVTIAALQWQARAYPALVEGNQVVKCRVVGSDPNGMKQAAASRVSTHMSYQVMEEDEAWEEQHDRMLISVPIVGTAFKKSYYSGRKGCNISELVLAQDLVLDYYATSVNDCARKTHRIPLSRNEIHEKSVRGVFRDVTGESWLEGTPQPVAAQKSDLRRGMSEPTPDDTTPFRGLEQHVSLDLDGDGYAEPYIITVEETTETVLRIVTRFEPVDIERVGNRIVAIRSIEYFTKYGFIPAPDGGIYDIGFGILLGPLNESVNTIINQMVDAGTMANTAGGFLSRGVKIRGGSYTFAPLEWKRVDSTGEDLQKGIVPLPVREPSAVLLQLLPLLINYTNRISGSTDAATGENPGQNTPAETQRSMVEQGTKIYNAIFKRIWRSMKEEFKKLFILNARYLPVESRYGDGPDSVVLRADYMQDTRAVVPAADPNLASDTIRFQQATLVKQAAATTGGYDRDAVERMWLRSLKVDGYEALFKGSDKVPPLPNPKMMLEEAKAKVKEMQIKAHLQEVALKIQSDQEKVKAQVDLLKAQAAKALVEAGGNQAAQRVREFEVQVAAKESEHKTLQGYLELAMKGMQDDKSGGVSGLESPQSHQGGDGGADGQDGGGQGGMGGGAFYGG
jgi:chaperonin GroES